MPDVRLDPAATGAVQRVAVSSAGGATADGPFLLSDASSLAAPVPVEVVAGVTVVGAGGALLPVFDPSEITGVPSGEPD